MIDQLPGVKLIPINEVPSDTLLEIITRLDLGPTIIEVILEANRRNILQNPNIGSLQ